MEFGWSTAKIRNFLLYKQINKTPLTPLENDVIQRYFGRNQRKELISDLHQRKQALIRIVLIDILVISLMLGTLPNTLNVIYPIDVGSNITPSQILTLTGKVITLEYRFSSTNFFGMEFKSASPTITVIHLNTSSLMLDGNIQLELGQTYTITYDNRTKKCVSFSLLEDR